MTTQFLLSVMVAAGGIVIILSLIFAFVLAGQLRRKGKFSGSFAITLLHVTIPRSEEEKQENPKHELALAEQLYINFASLKHSGLKDAVYGVPHFTFELVSHQGKEGKISIYLAVPKGYTTFTEKQIHSYYPDAVVERVPDYTIFLPTGAYAASQLKLKKENFIPIATYNTLESDPLQSVINSLSQLSEREAAAVQIVFHPLGSDWHKRGQKVAHEMQQGKSLKEASGGELAKALRGTVKGAVAGKKDEPKYPEPQEQLTPGEQELVKSISTKASKIGFAVNLRLVTAAPDEQTAQSILENIEATLTQYSAPELNSFAKCSLTEQKVVNNYIFRYLDKKNSMALNTEELASIFHFPTREVATPTVEWARFKQAAPPIDMPQEGLFLGTNSYRNTDTPIFMKEDDRRRHMYIVGQTGTGKTTLMESMIEQDIQNGKGVCLIDPHGEMTQHVLERIPAERAEDVILFDPSDTEKPLGLNMLEYTLPEQKTFVVNEMINIFDKLYDLKQTGGPMFEQYMRNAMLLIMEDPDSGSTLMEIPRVLTDKAFRSYKLSRTNNMVVKNFWEKEAQQAGGEASLANIAPYVTSKLNTFIANDIMRPIIGQQHSSFDVREAMDSSKILLLNLSKGTLGELNSYLLGMVLVGKIFMAALGRVRTPESERRDFYLYIDEFQNVTTSTIASVFAEARKYRLNMIVANQFLGQLDEKIRDAVLGNVGNIAAFRVGPEDTELLAKQFAPTFDDQDLLNIESFNAYMRMVIDNTPAQPFNFRSSPPQTKPEAKRSEQIKQLSRTKYGRDKQAIELELKRKQSIV